MNTRCIAGIVAAVALLAIQARASAQTVVSRLEREAQEAQDRLKKADRDRMAAQERATNIPTPENRRALQEAQRALDEAGKLAQAARERLEFAKTNPAPWRSKSFSPLDRLALVREARTRLHARMTLIQWYLYLSKSPWGRYALRLYGALPPEVFGSGMAFSLGILAWTDLSHAADEEVIAAHLRLLDIGFELAGHGEEERKNPAVAERVRQLQEERARIEARLRELESSTDSSWWYEGCSPK